MTISRKMMAITVGVVVIAVVVIFLVVQALSPTSYGSANEIMARLQGEGFEVAKSERPSPPIEVPGATPVVILGHGYKGRGWIAVSEGSVDAVKRTFDDAAVVFVEGADWVFAVADDTLKDERTEALAGEVADALGGEVVAS